MSTLKEGFISLVKKLQKEASSKLPLQREGRSSPLGHFLWQNAHRFERGGVDALCQAALESSDEALREAAAKILEERGSLLRAQSPSLLSPALVRTFFTGAPAERLSLLPDGKLLVGLINLTAKRYDLEAGALSTNIGAPSVCNPDQNYARYTQHGEIVSLPSKDLLHFFDVQNSDNKREVKLSLPKARPHCIHVSEEGDRVAIGATDGNIIIHNITKKRGQKLKVHDDYINGIALRGELLAFVSSDRTLRVWSLGKKPKEIYNIPTGSSWSGVAISPDGAWIASSAIQDEKVKLALLSVKSGEVKFFDAYVDGNVISFLPGDLIAVGSQQNRILIHQRETGAAISEWAGHTDRVTDLLPLPGGLVASASFDKSVRIWDPSILVTPDGIPHSRIALLDIDAKGELIVGGGYGQVSLVSKNKCERIPTGGAVEAVCLSRDGKLFALVKQSVAIEVSSSENNQVVCRMPIAGNVNAMVFSRDGSTLAVILGRTLCVYDANDGKLVSKAETFWNNPQSLAAHHDGETLVGVARDGNRYRIEFKKGKLREIPRHQWKGSWPYLSRDGERVAIIGSGHNEMGRSVDGIIEVVNLFSGEAFILPLGAQHYTTIPKGAGHIDDIKAITFVGDKHLASAGLDGSICLWEIESGKEVSRYEADSPLYSLASSENMMLAAGDGAGRIFCLKVLLRSPAK